jgi:hypothetical protein
LGKAYLRYPANELNSKQSPRFAVNQSRKPKI